MLKLDDFKNKKVLIMSLGLHGGGVGAAAFFARLGSRVIVTDLKTKKELTPSLKKLKRWKNITYHLGGHRPKDFQQADYVIKGPGVPENSRFLKVAKRAGVPILSDVEIFFLTCPAQIIGITGTKGKSTATWLLGEFLKLMYQAKLGTKKVWIGGNIRRSALEFLARVRRSDIVVLELSSFQLDSLKNSRLSPHIALITNIFPDHLNRYPSMADYIASKANIFKYQGRSDYLFLNGQDALLKRLAKKAPSPVIKFYPKRIIRPFRKKISKNIPAYHLANIAAAVAIAKHLGAGDGAIGNALADFRGLESRMEIVRKIRGIEFVNDTTATNPTAAEQAVRAAKKRIGKHGLHVIAGGYDKGLPVEGFIRALQRYAASVAFLPGKASEKMKSKIPGLARARPRAGKNQKSKIGKLADASSMGEAVKVAYRNAKRGDVVLLSPGAASFGQFRHEFDRGEQFVKAVEKLRH